MKENRFIRIQYKTGMRKRDNIPRFNNNNNYDGKSNKNSSISSTKSTKSNNETEDGLMDKPTQKLVCHGLKDLEVKFELENFAKWLVDTYEIIPYQVSEDEGVSLFVLIYLFM